jgi:hypothetical protein
VSKKKAISFSLTAEQAQRIEARSDEHGFLNRAEYLLCLWELDQHLQLVPTLNEFHQKVLRPAAELGFVDEGTAAAGIVEAIAERVVARLGTPGEGGTPLERALGLARQAYQESEDRILALAEDAPGASGEAKGEEKPPGAAPDYPKRKANRAPRK